MLTVESTTESTSTSTGALTVTGGVGIGKNVQVGGYLGVLGNAVITGSAGNTLEVNGQTKLYNSLDVSGDTTLKGDVDIPNGDLDIGGTLYTDIIKPYDVDSDVDIRLGAGCLNVRKGYIKVSSMGTTGVVAPAFGTTLTAGMVVANRHGIRCVAQASGAHINPYYYPTTYHKPLHYLPFSVSSSLQFMITASHDGAGTISVKNSNGSWMEIWDSGNKYGYSSNNSPDTGNACDLDGGVSFLITPTDTESKVRIGYGITGVNTSGYLGGGYIDISRPAVVHIKAYPLDWGYYANIDIIFNYNTTTLSERINTTTSTSSNVTIAGYAIIQMQHCTITRL